MAEVLSGHAAPEAAGALLMLMRFHREVADELAGFAQALREIVVSCPRPALDWPSYATVRSRGAPLFLLAARLRFGSSGP
ncbi:MAG: hypothetical protein AAF366_11405 [Pseudomonadota bacterium]